MEFIKICVIIFVRIGADKVNNTNFNNEVNGEVVKIPEVQMQDVTEEVSNNVVSNKIESDNNGEVGSKKSTVLLILLFVFLFGYIFAMPYISEFFNNLNKESDKPVSAQPNQKEEISNNDKKEPVIEKIETKELVCTSIETQINNYTLVTIEKFYYDKNNQILNSSIIYNYKFNILDDEYNLLMKKCEEDSLKYLTHEGFSTSCSNDNLNILLNYEFDLETFKTITDGDVTISANSSYKQKIDDIKNNLITKGYTCS